MKATRSADTHARRPAGDLIAAIATPPGPCERAIVRLSGWGAVQVVEFLCTPSPLTPPPHEWRTGGPSLLSLPPPWPPIPVEVFVTRAPRSYTREDVVELHLPGAPPLVEAVLAACLAGGARLAEPGEFTRRAVQHGRIDLAQAEAVSVLIAAEDEASLRAAQSRLAGGFSCRIDALRRRCVELCAEVEAGIDFTEEAIEFISRESLLAGLAALADEIAMLRAAESATAARSGLPLVLLVGPQNAGKSSLFNRLLGRPRVLASPEAGTTRDVIVEEVVLGGVRCRLADTPGSSSSADVFAELADQIRSPLAATADLLVYVQDSSVGRASPDPVAPPPDRSIRVSSKSDLSRTESPSRRAGLLLSSLTGAGCSALSRSIGRMLRRRSVREGAGRSHGTARQDDALRRAHEALFRAFNAARDGVGAEFVAADLRASAATVGEITGESVTDSVLAEIFARFCVGK